MPAPRKIARSDRFVSLDMESVRLGERNDCVVKAFAMTAGVPYSSALRTATAYGRKPRHGMFNAQWLRMFAEAGVELRHRLPAEFIFRYPGVHATALKNVTTHHPARFPRVWADGRRYLLVTATHMVYVENGVAHDWSGGRAFRVCEIYEIVER